MQKQYNTLKINLLFNKNTFFKETLRVNNFKFLMIKNAKFSGYQFFMNPNK